MSIDMKDVRGSLEGWFGLHPTDQQITDFLAKHEGLRAEIEHNGFDTVCREVFADELARDLGLQHWPLGGDSKEYSDKFFRDFAERAKAAGYDYRGQG